MDRNTLAIALTTGVVAWFSGVIAIQGYINLVAASLGIGVIAWLAWSHTFGRRLAQLAATLGADSDRLAEIERAARALVREKHDARTRMRSVEATRIAEHEAHEEALTNTVHELRTPLTTIVATLEMVQLGMLEDPADRRELIAQADAACHHLSFLVNDLLDAAAIAAGRLRLDTVDFPVQGLFDEALRILTPTAQIRDITLRIEGDGSALTQQIHADRMRALQVLFNLSGNAIKYSEDNTTVILRARTDESTKTVRFEVHDQGVGVPPEMRDELFGRFARVHRAEDSHASGSGVGLHFSKTLVEHMQGEIGYDQRTDQPGSVFWFALPLADPTTDSAETTQRRTDTIGLTAERG